MRLSKFKPVINDFVNKDLPAQYVVRRNSRETLAPVTEEMEEIAVPEAPVVAPFETTGEGDDEIVEVKS